MSSKKIGFWAVFAIVSGSQIGSGAFVLPAALAPYGVIGLCGWIISGFGAMALALVFAYLCSKFPKTGGPHVYVDKAFGEDIAFFVGWTYWVISWISTSVVIVTSIAYLSPFIGNSHPLLSLILEILLLFIITILNLRGIQSAGRVEIFLTFLKFAPLIIISACAIGFFDVNNFAMNENLEAVPYTRLLAQVSLITLWGFIGLESATASAGSVENPKKTISKAIVLGTLSVVILYLFNSIAIIGLIPGKDLAISSAPYIDATKIIFGGNWYLLISLVASIVCIGTTNAWVLTSGQIALGLAEDGLMPKFFATKNKNGAPFWSLIISSSGILPLLILTSNSSLAKQINEIIDFSATSFLFIYFICAIAFLVILHKQKERHYYEYFFGIIALIFCSWVIFETPLTTLFTASIFTLSGIIPYILWYRKKVNAYGV